MPPKKAASTASAAAESANARRHLVETTIKDPVPQHRAAEVIFIVANIAAVIAAVFLAKFLKKVEDASAAPVAAAPAAPSSCDGYGLSAIPDTLTAMIPFFLLLIVLEHVLVRWVNMKSEGSKLVPVDTWASVAGGLQQLIMQEACFRLVGARELYCATYNRFGAHYTPVWVTQHTLCFIVAWLFDDFVYYLFHRATHTYGILWLAHYVHHSGERFNLSTALRQTGLQAISGFAFRLVLVAPFVHPYIFYSVAPFLTISQFWFHSCIVRTLPFPLELLLNTPSHHRVHHTRRVHANHGGFFIVWDRLFGTFRSELSVLADERMEQELAANGGEEICFFGIHDAVDTWTEQATQWQWLRQHGTSLVNLFRGPGYYQTKRQSRVPAILSEPRIRQDDAPRGFAVSAYLLVFLLAAVYQQVYLLKQSKRGLLDSNVAYIVAALFGPWLALYTQGLVCDRDYAKALLLEVARIAFFIAAAGPTLAAPGSAAIAIASALWIVLLLDRFGPRKPPLSRSEDPDRELSLARSE